MTGGRNISLDYYGILEDGSHNPHTYRDADIFLRGGRSDGAITESVGTVSEVYYTLLFLFKNNKALKISRSANPDSAYRTERLLIRQKLADLKALPRVKEYLDGMPEYVSSGFHEAEVMLAHELANLTDKKVVNNAVENASLNPNSIVNILATARDEEYDHVELVSPYMFAALYKDKEGNVILDEAQNLLNWLEKNPDSTIHIITNSVLTSDNFFTQSGHRHGPGATAADDRGDAPAVAEEAEGERAEPRARRERRMAAG